MKKLDKNNTKDISREILNLFDNLKVNNEIIEIINKKHLIIKNMQYEIVE